MTRLIVGENAAMTRRRLGATSWVALEELASRHTTTTTDSPVVASIRDVADALGLSKNAAHRAIRRLVEAGLVTPVQSRSIDGRFVAGAYHLTVPADVLHLDTVHHTSRTTRQRSTHNRRHHTDDTTQLSLLSP
jgi:DNA-binding IclR family transcriptional regulator